MDNYFDEHMGIAVLGTFHQTISRKLVQDKLDPGLTHLAQSKDLNGMHYSYGHSVTQGSNGTTSTV
jgi:hypothetical protein